MAVRNLNTIIVFFLFCSLSLQIAIKQQISEDTASNPDFANNSQLIRKKEALEEDESLNQRAGLMSQLTVPPTQRQLFVDHIKSGDLDGKCVLISGISSFIILILVCLLFVFVCFARGSTSVTDDEAYFPGRKLTDYIDSKRRKKIRLVERNKAKTRRLTVEGIKEIMKEHGKQRTFEIVNRVLEDNGCPFLQKRTLFDKEYDDISAYLNQREKSLKDDLSPAYLLNEVKRYMKLKHHINISQHKVLLLLTSALT